MSIKVELAQLRTAIEDTDRAPYFLTVGADGRPHCVAATWRWTGDELALSVGNRSLANGRANGSVSILWAPREPSGHSLIVNAEVTRSEGTGSGDNVVHVRPTSAVLHRPAEGPTAEGCDADCVPLLRDA